MNRTPLMTRLVRLVAIAVLFLSASGHAQNAPTKRIRFDLELYCAHATLHVDNSASWVVFNTLGKYDAGPNNAAELLTHYRGAPEKRRKNGLLVFSDTHSVPFTEKEKKLMTPHLIGRFANKEWRENENKMVEELVALANKEGVPVWINVTGDTRGVTSFKLITDPKLTLNK